jgi:hypothetical protein
MRTASCVVGTLLLAGPAQAATPLQLTGYQDAQGAITVAHQGDFVDPYFATRALLTARQSGLDITAAAGAWIAWLLPRQQADGLFPRFCRQDGAWQACQRADADDALLAGWRELLYLSAPCSGMAPAWQHSAKLAGDALQQLQDPVRGIYLISAQNQVGLFMDNVEIYAAQRAISGRQRCMGQAPAARRTQAAAQALAGAIGHAFRPQRHGPWRVSTQDAVPARFYPERVAQLIPVLFGLPDDLPPRLALRQWLQAHGEEWLAAANDPYPWGVLAVAAQGVGDHRTAQRWLARAAPLRHGQRWNVLEEAAFQSLRGTSRQQ